MRRRFALIVGAILVISVPVFGQVSTFTLDTFDDSFETFSEEFAKSLPMNSTIGLNWSDAYIGQILAVPPHFGIGVTTGVTTIPGSVFTDLTDDLGVDTSGGVEDLSALGVPLPGYAVDARIGGFFIPFDIGVKFGTIPNLPLGKVKASYTNVGADVRYAILDGGVLPKLSVGIGYNYLAGNIKTPLGLDATSITGVVADLNGDGNPETYSLTASDPELEFGWQANVFDFKAQISKSFIFIEPHFGLGAAVGSASTQTGLSTDIAVSGGSGVITADQLGEVAGIDIDDTGLTLESQVNAVSFRVFGGASLNLTVFRLDLGAMYNLTSGSLGGTVGARFQL